MSFPADVVHPVRAVYLVCAETTECHMCVEDVETVGVKKKNDNDIHGDVCTAAGAACVPVVCGIASAGIVYVLVVCALASYVDADDEEKVAWACCCRR